MACHEPLLGAGRPLPAGGVEAGVDLGAGVGDGVDDIAVGDRGSQGQVPGVLAQDLDEVRVAVGEGPGTVQRAASQATPRSAAGSARAASAKPRRAAARRPVLVEALGVGGGLGQDPAQRGQTGAGHQEGQRIEALAQVVHRRVQRGQRGGLHLLQLVDRPGTGPRRARRPGLRVRGTSRPGRGRCPRCRPSRARAPPPCRTSRTRWSGPRVMLNEVKTRRAHAIAAPDQVRLALRSSLKISRVSVGNRTSPVRASTETTIQCRARAWAAISRSRTVLPTPRRPVAAPCSGPAGAARRAAARCRTPRSGPGVPPARTGGRRRRACRGCRRGP